MLSSVIHPDLSIFADVDGPGTADLTQLSETYPGESLDTYPSDSVMRDLQVTDDNCCPLWRVTEPTLSPIWKQYFQRQKAQRYIAKKENIPPTLHGNAPTQFQKYMMSLQGVDSQETLSAVPAELRALGRCPSPYPGGPWWLQVRLLYSILCVLCLILGYKRCGSALGLYISINGPPIKLYKPDVTS